MENNILSTTEQQPSPRKPGRFEIEIQSDFEAAFHEKNRREKENARLRAFVNRIGGIKAYEDFTFDKFLTSWGQQEAFDAAYRFHPDHDNLFLWGPSRVGKTHLATAIARMYFERGDSIQIITVLEFKDLLRQFESEHRYADKIQFLTNLVEARILIIHELGRGKITELVQENLWSILERRILARRNGFIGTSNFSLMDIGRTHGGTISARIAELCTNKGIVKFRERAA